MKKNKTDLIEINVHPKAWYIMATTSLNPKGEVKSRKRLVRIKRNLFRELAIVFWGANAFWSIWTGYGVAPLVCLYVTLLHCYVWILERKSLEK